VRLEGGNAYYKITHISIHAPIQGAIKEFRAISNDIIISIHAPIQGAIVAAAAEISKDVISIHAPIQGAIVSDVFKRYYH